MTPQELNTELTDHGYTDSNQNIRAINQAIRNIAYRRAWPFMEKILSLTFDGTNAAPSNSPADLRAVMKVIDTGTGRRIVFKRTDDMEEAYGSSLTQGGDPFFYYFEGTALKVWQVPASTQTLRLRYLKTVPTIVVSDPESAIVVPPDYHEAIAARALFRLALLNDDTDIAGPFKALYDELFVEMSEALLKQQYDEPEYIHVIDADDYDYDW